MTSEQERNLMIQIASIYQEWKVNGLNNNDKASVLINYLFNLAMEIDSKRMFTAWNMDKYDY